MNYYFEVIAQIGLWTFLGFCFFLPVAVGRMFLVSAGAFIAIGAYAYAITMSEFSVLSTIIVLLGFIAVALVVSTALAKLWADELILGSLAVHMIVIEAIKIVPEITGGHTGIGTFPTIAYSGGGPFLALTLGCVLSCLLFYRFFLRRTSIVLLVGTAVGTDPVLTESRGISPEKVRYGLLVIAILGAALGGVIWALLKGYVGPGDFSLMMSIKVLVVVLVAQLLGPRLGPFVGATVVVAIPELIRATDLLSPSSAGHADQILFGLFLTLWAVTSTISFDRPISIERFNWR